jgi:uncharacterized protein (TIGR00255 family)
MPVRSMTGFGQSEARTPSGQYRVEIKAVNNRFLDIQVRSPKSLYSLEQKIKELITDTVSRGSVSVFIGCDKENELGKLSWDAEAVKNYVDIFKEIRKRFKLSGDITLSDLLHFSDFLKTESIQADEKTLWKHFKPVLTDAVKDFQKSRETEGGRIVKDLRKTLEEITRLLGEVEARAPQRVTEYLAVLTERVQKLLKNPPEESRIAMEIALMADKLDISEECTRLRVHLEAFVKDFDGGEPVGKRMNFVLQEMNREANTIGSKANDAVISHLSITLKEKIEQIREQIQNIE